MTFVPLGATTLCISKFVLGSAEDNWIFAAAAAAAGFVAAAAVAGWMHTVAAAVIVVGC